LFLGEEQAEDGKGLVMKNRHAIRWLMLVMLMLGAAVSSGAAETAGMPGTAPGLAQPPTHPEAIIAVNPQEMAALLVMFIPWNDPTPTPAVPTGNGGGNGQNNGGGGNGQNNGGGGSQGSGGNGQTSGGSSDSGGGKTGGSPGGSTGLGGGETHDNPEPATVVTTLLGVGLLGLAGLRRRRWSLG
jgi:MYXO-CTERM domain-containing protein